MGDPSDNVPGLGQFNPQFGRKTAVKLMKQHGNVDNLLVAASKRTVGKPYIQDTLKAYSAEVRRNLQVLSLRRLVFLSRSQRDLRQTRSVGKLVIGWCCLSGTWMSNWIAGGAPSEIAAMINLH